MKILLTPPLQTKQALKGIKCLIAMIFITTISKGQTTTTNTLSTINVVGSAVIDSVIVGKDTIIAEKDIRVEGDIKIKGNAKVNGNLKINGKIKFDATTGISYLEPVSTSTAQGQFFFGKQSNAFGPQTFPMFIPFNSSTLTEGADPKFNFSGMLNSYSQGSTIDASMHMGMASWGSGIIEVGGVLNNVGSPGLLMNYFCGRNIFMCTGSNGGNVYAGDFFSAQKHVEIGGVLGIVNAPTNIALDVFVNDGIGIRVKSYFDPLSTISVFNTGTVFNGKNTFNVLADGRTEILTESNKKALSISGQNSNSIISENFVVYGDGRVQIGKSFGNPVSALTVGGQIAMINGTNGNYEFLVDNSGALYCRSVRVKLGTLPDYVFEENYKLKTLNEVELYYKKHKHLEGVPSEKEVVKNDLDLGEMASILLKKVEELTIYTVELNKQLEISKMEIELLKKK